MYPLSIERILKVARSRLTHYGDEEVTRRILPIINKLESFVNNPNFELKGKPYNGAGMYVDY